VLFTESPGLAIFDLFLFVEIDEMYKHSGGEVDVPPYIHPPPWIPLQMRQSNADYNSDLRQFLPRKLCLRRVEMSDTLGFNVRGGTHIMHGMYVSWVKPGSEAEALGLREGDQILEANSVNFETIEHAKAVGVLKGSLEVTLIVRYFPFGYRRTYGNQPPEAVPNNAAYR
jgi:hypothetical protein